ncbi:cell division inhibitor [Buchnera aphidicola (Cinara tujafilina)]|uniref:Probable septum site-determining protein MinC n=1 Tax=Buchnera aphidicola (Cinara tujafilina) TaxID=261317 RepID=F7WZD6_9GAMM|nr:septum site-determining protein MinC [Buchnera aphidicola]AEH39798.1 cell division inhibitor [Buchnera aphidicola (Cinara tujafilina)]
MKKISIILKSSNFFIPVLYLYDINIKRTKRAIFNQLKKSPNFCKNMPVILNVEGLSQNVDWINMKIAISSTGLFISGVNGCINNKLRDLILLSGLPIFSGHKKNYFNIINKMNKISKDIVKKPVLNSSNAHIINYPVRSGQKIYVPNSDLIVTNNVSTGAELISDGHIHIYGSMRGRVLAGANGDTTKKIFCTQLFAELISIAGEYWIIEQIPLKYIGKITKISLKNGLIIIKKLN